MKYLSILCFLFLVGCRGTEAGDDKVEIGFGTHVVTINGCQYIIYVDGTRGGTSMVHAGNCNNPFHQAQVFDKYIQSFDDNGIYRMAVGNKIYTFNYDTILSQKPLHKN